MRRYGHKEPAPVKLIVKAVPPFDFDLSAKIFSDGDRQIQKYENGTHWQVVRIGSKLVRMTVKALGNVENPRLSVKLEPDEGISYEDKRVAKEMTTSFFGLKLDIEPFYEEVRGDRILSGLTRRLRGLRSPTTPTIFEALICSIVEQQISLKVAHSLEKTLIKTFGDSLQVGDEVYYAFPTQLALASSSVEQLRRCGLSVRKAEYILNASKLIARGKLDLDRFRAYEDINEIIKELDSIHGIGVWTAELTIVRSMQRFEAMPADDLGLRRCISHYYCGDKRISPEEARKIAEKWGRWKGLASFYLIIAERLGIKA